MSSAITPYDAKIQLYREAEVPVTEHRSPRLRQMHHSNIDKAEGYRQAVANTEARYKRLVEAAKGAANLLKSQYETLLGRYPDYGPLPELDALEQALADLQL